MRRTRRSIIIRTILTVVAITGMLAVAAVTPNALQLLKYIHRKNRSDANRRYYVNRVSKRLAGKGLLKSVKLPSGIPVYRLTNEGRKELARYQLGELKIKQPKKWDGKFRLIIFDIKEWKRIRRDELRNILTDLGFKRLQNSVWVHPYECGEVTALLKSYLRLGKEIIYITAEKIENDKWLKKEFELD